MFLFVWVQLPVYTFQDLAQCDFRVRVGKWRVSVYGLAYMVDEGHSDAYHWLLVHDIPCLRIMRGRTRVQ